MFYKWGWGKLHLLCSLIARQTFQEYNIFEKAFKLISIQFSLFNLSPRENMRKYLVI